MANTMTGRIYGITPTVTKEFNGKQFYERYITLDATRYDQYTGEAMYPNFPQFIVSGEERCVELDGLAGGEVVTVSFDVRGAKYTDRETGCEKIFNRVQAYKIEPYAKSRARASAPAGAVPPLPDKEPDFEAEEKGIIDDLPF